jgi:sulfatase modifying factor 1
VDTQKIKKTGSNMKKLLFFGSLLALATGCEKSGGELIGVQGREPWFQADPYGMLYCVMGNMTQGPNDEDVPFAHNTKAKMVSIQAFYIDQTELTNNEYRQFVFHVRDSIARRLLAAGGNPNPGDYFISDAQFWEINPSMKGLMTYDESPDKAALNWDTKLNWRAEDESYNTDLLPLFLPEKERFYKRVEIDSRKLNFEYYRIDLRTAAKKTNRFIPEKGPVDPQAQNGHAFPTGKGDYTVNGKPKLDRSAFIIKDVINVYPDTLAWVHDFTYSFNEPMTNMYFWHPAFDEYPVVGVTWKQARAFCIWRTQLYNDWRYGQGEFFVQDFRLPTEAEWEYAARGGLKLSPFPWGGPYIRNARGCFLGNFKPMRGSYIDDGGFHTVKVLSYNPNDWGLYCMAGNVAEWTSNAFDESSYDFSHDLNPDYVYEPTAEEEQIPVLNRKVIRGGSWKDVGYYLETSTRSYEYQDTAKCYIGFRCVMTYLGRHKEDEL